MLISISRCQSIDLTQLTSFLNNQDILLILHYGITLHIVLLLQSQLSYSVFSRWPKTGYCI
jgi:hypothetical protein